MVANTSELARAVPATPHAEPAIRVAGLRKSYDGVVQALDGVDLELRRGELLALLGPNGAGKTTLVEILEGHRDADAGHVRVLGFDPAGASARSARGSASCCRRRAWTQRSPCARRSSSKG